MRCFRENFTYCLKGEVSDNILHKFEIYAFWGYLVTSLNMKQAQGDG